MGTSVEGAEVGSLVGSDVGELVGSIVGKVGPKEGPAVGRVGACEVGFAVGLVEGVCVCENK